MCRGFGDFVSNLEDLLELKMMKMDLLHLQSNFFPAIFLVFWEREIFLCKTNFGGKEIYFAKRLFNLAKKVIR
jgi:hypothetical protein